MVPVEKRHSLAFGFLILLGYVLVKAGGFGPILAEPGKLGWGPGFWKVFAPTLMAMIAFWSTLSLNMPDFTRFGGSQEKQVRGQLLGLPTTMTFIALVAILTTSGGSVLYGEQIWDPAKLADRFDSPIVVVVALIALVLATVSANLAANVVSPSYDFSNAFPKKITFGHSPPPAGKSRGSPTRASEIAEPTRSGTARLTTETSATPLASLARNRWLSSLPTPNM